MFDKLKYISFFSFLSLGVFASEVIDQEFTTRSSSISLEDRTASGGEYANLDTEFERVIGLGRNCLTKAQINGYFNANSHHFHTKTGKADLFDWMVINNFNLFIESISSKLENFFEKKDFVMNNSSEHSLIDAKNGIGWVHLLSSYLLDIPPELKKESSYLLSIFHDNFDKEKSKINYLKEKFIQAKNKKTLYVVSHFNISFDLILKLRDALNIIRDGDKNFMLLLVSEKDIPFSFENIIIRNAQNVNSSWLVEPNHTYWKVIFDEFKFSSDIWN